MDPAAQPRTMEKGLVSVLIPAYNSERWIDETLQSVAEQSYPQIEVIVVDDGSTDGTASIAADCGARVVRQRNSGPSVARNRALAESRGEYIQWLDADDVLSPDKIESGVELLRA